MKSKNTILLVGILAVLVLVYLGVSYLGGDSRSKSFRDVLVDIDKDVVTRVEIIGGGTTTTLSGGPEDWKVELPDGSSKPAKPGSINSMLSSLSTIEPSRIASRSQDKWTDFQVDTTGTRVKVFEGSNVSLDIILGRFGVEGQRSFYTYVRLADENDTYVANNFMSMSVSKDPDSYRNNEVLRLKKDSLTSISFDYPDSAFSLVKSDSKWFIDNTPADSANTASYISGLSLVTSRSFATLSGNAARSVVFGFSNQEDITVSLDENGILSSGYNTHEVFSDSTATGKLFKGRSYFMK